MHERLDNRVKSFHCNVKVALGVLTEDVQHSAQDVGLEEAGVVSIEYGKEGWFVFEDFTEE